MNDDRIGDVYEGEHGTPQTQRTARERIHWMCRQVADGEVLDLGCSQGITAMLLAREGRRTTGVDRESKVIEQARERLSREELTVRERVTFLVAEGAELPFADASFDTVLLGEVIEHLVDPRPVLREAWRVLRPNGRLVLTTPYGLFPYHDHKEPLYLGTVFVLLDGFVIETLDLLDSYLILTARRGEDADASYDKSWPTALDVAERRLAAQDQVASERKDRAADLQRQLRGLKEENDRLVLEVAQEREERARLVDAQRDQQAQLLERAETAVRFQLEREQAQDRLAALEAAHGELEQTQGSLEALQRSVDQLRVERDEARAALSAAQGELEHRATEVAEHATAADVVREQAMMRAAELEQTQRTIESLRLDASALDAAHAEIGRLTAEVTVARELYERALRGAAPTAAGDAGA